MKQSKTHKSTDTFGSVWRPPFFQPKLTINQPNDKYEQEADAMADKVMRMPSSRNEHTFFRPADISSVQRKCAHCEEEEKIQKKSEGGASESGVAPSIVNDVINSAGQPLDTGTRKFFEPRFGADFSNVRIHNDSTAAHSAQSINARAYTTGKNIVFNQNQFAPGTDSGKKLLAHELTHVVQQQSSGKNNIQRDVAANSSCSNKVDPAALPKPFIFIELAETLAQMMLGSVKLDLAFNSGDKDLLSGKLFSSYRGRFGDPLAVKGKFKNRFNRKMYDSLQEAEISEMKSLISRFDSINNLFSKDITYHCMGSSAAVVNGCSFSKCEAGVDLKACLGKRAIAICPPFWSRDAKTRSLGLIHEASHILFSLGDHDKAPFAQSSSERMNEAECYSSVIADLNSTNVFDPSCPTI